MPMSRIRRSPVLVLLAALTASGQQAQQMPPPTPTLRTTVHLVVVDVEVTDRNGRPVRDLRPEDFVLLEDGRPQKISSFQYVDVEGMETAAGSAATKPVVVSLAGAAADSSVGEKVRNRRLIALLFDLTSLHPDELQRARDAALDFVRHRMTPADLVAVVTLGTRLNVLTDFTTDRETVAAALGRLRPGAEDQLADLASAPATNGEADVTEDTGAAWTPDETEFNVFNTDRKLEAVQDLARLLAAIPGKKILMQFTGGIVQTGEENRTALEAAVDAANRANVSVYTVDARGLLAEVPGGDASHAAAAGQAMFTGAAVFRQRDTRQDSRDTLQTLAEDTGGRAFFDLGELGRAFEQVRQDTAGFYLLGYTPTDTHTDGRWRAITVRVRRPGLHLRYRNGYYAPRDYQHFTAEDRERQLLDALRSSTPMVELPLAVQTAVFRMNDREYFVPVAAKLPAHVLEWAQKKGSREAEFDFAAEVRDRTGRAVGSLQDTIRVRLGEQLYQQVAHRALLYQGGLVLPPGQYRLKFVARENATGRIGTFETDVPVNAVPANELGLSSLLLSAQLVPASGAGSVERQSLGGSAMRQSPLEVGGERLVPSVTNVFTADQTLYVFFQCYLPPQASPEHLRAGLLFFRNGVLVSRTPLVAPVQVDARTRTASYRLSLPLGHLAPGRYTVQAVAVVAGTPYAGFGRAELVVLPVRRSATAAAR